MGQAIQPKARAPRCDGSATWPPLPRTRLARSWHASLPRGLKTPLSAAQAYTGAEAAVGGLRVCWKGKGAAAVLLLLLQVACGPQVLPPHLDSHVHTAPHALQHMGFWALELGLKRALELGLKRAATSEAGNAQHAQHASQRAAGGAPPGMHGV